MCYTICTEGSHYRHGMQHDVGDGGRRGQRPTSRTLGGQKTGIPRQKRQKRGHLADSADKKRRFQPKNKETADSWLVLRTLGGHLADKKRGFQRKNGETADTWRTLGGQSKKEKFPPHPLQKKEILSLRVMRAHVRMI